MVSLLERQRDPAPCGAHGLVTCIMIVTSLSCVNAAQELRTYAVPQRPQPRTGGGVVEHADHARRLARVSPLRRIPKEFRDCAQHAGASARIAGRSWAVGAPPLQRASAARRVCSDAARARP